jgi:hypothetical protein
MKMRKQDEESLVKEMHWVDICRAAWMLGVVEAPTKGAWLGTVRPLLLNGGRAEKVRRGVYRALPPRALGT